LPTPQRKSNGGEDDTVNQELTSALGQQWGAKWLLEHGVFSDLAGDELMAMALVEPTLADAKLTVDQDLFNDGEHPVVTYHLTLRRFYSFLYKMSLLTGFGKLLALVAVYLGAPIGIESRVARRATEYLPPRCRVLVEVT